MPGHFPGVPARCERVQEADFAAESLEAVVAWGVLFHLPAAEPRAVLQQVSGWLRPSVPFRFTGGDAEGVRVAEMNGVTFRYASLSMSGYRDALGGRECASRHTTAIRGTTPCMSRRRPRRPPRPTEDACERLA